MTIGEDLETFIKRVNVERTNRKLPDKYMFANNKMYRWDIFLKLPLSIKIDTIKVTPEVYGSLNNLYVKEKKKSNLWSEEYHIV
jgi:hypothetical protein